LFAFLGERCESLAAGTAEAPASESTQVANA
jgi:hypothetical protein